MGFTWIPTRPHWHSLSLSTVASAPTTVMAAEVDNFRSMAIRALRDVDTSSDPRGFRRTEAARAIDKAAATVASEDLLRLILSEIRRSPVGRSDLVSAAKKMNTLLQDHR